MIGGPLLFLGILWIKTASGCERMNIENEKIMERNLQRWGWILAIFGWLFSVGGAIWIVIMVATRPRSSEVAQWASL
jgi:hypothetical protein